MSNNIGSSAGGQRATPADRQKRVERVAELINKYHLTYEAIGRRLGIKKRLAMDDAAIARKQGLIKPR